MIVAAFWLSTFQRMVCEMKHHVRKHLMFSSFFIRNSHSHLRAKSFCLIFLARDITTVAVQSDRNNTVRITCKRAVLFYCIHGVPPNFS